MNRSAYLSPRQWGASILLGVIALGFGEVALAQAPMDPPALPAPHRYATNLRMVRDILKGENSVTKITDGQCLQLNNGNYLGDNSANTANPGFLNMKTVSFANGVTVRAQTRRYLGYGPNGGLQSGGAIFKKLILDTVNGVTFDGFAIHRDVATTKDDPCIHYQGINNVTFRCIEMLGFKPTGNETNWKNMVYGDTYNNQWSTLPQGIRRNTGTNYNITVEYCLTHFTCKTAVYMEFSTDCIIRRNAFCYSSMDFLKIEGMTGSVWEDNIFYKAFPTDNGSDIDHCDGMQTTTSTANSSGNYTIKRNVMFDCVGRKFQGIFMEQDGAYVGPNNRVIEDNIVFAPATPTANLITITQSGGNNKIRNNTVIADVHRGSTTPNILTRILNRAGETPTGDEGKYNISDMFSWHATVSQTGNQVLSETNYTTSHLYDYTSASNKIIDDPAINGDGLLDTNDGLSGTFKLNTSVLRRLSWKIGSTITDPNNNGGAGAWRAFLAYGATPSGWVPPGGGGGWVAFNDHVAATGTHAKATRYATNGTASGLLKNISTGANTSVTLTTSQSGASMQSNTAAPASGTPAYNTFNGYVSFLSATGGSIELSGTATYTHSFTGLDTGPTKTYKLTATAIRGGTSYHDRWTLITLNSATSATAAHSTGNGVVVISPTQVAIWSGENHLTGQGWVASWTNIDPGSDGAFSIVSSRYTGSTPNVGDGTAGNETGTKGYGVGGIRLEEVP